MNNRDNLIPKSASIKYKTKDSAFIFQITDEILSIAHCAVDKRSKYFVDLKTYSLAAEQAGSATKIHDIFRQLGYKNNYIIVSVPRNLVTCRYLKIPTRFVPEIERILSFQVSRYLPYPPEELISGYEIVNVDKDGYSHVNLIIVLRNVIEKHLKIVEELRPRRFNIVLGSYGLSNFYSYVKPQDKDTLLLVNFNPKAVEVAVVNNQKLLYSRYFKVNRNSPQWENVLAEEVRKTRDAYLKEISQQKPKKIIFISKEEIPASAIEATSEEVEVPVEVCPIDMNWPVIKNVAEKIEQDKDLYTNLIGFGLVKLNDSLNLLAEDYKERLRKAYLWRERMKLLAIFIGACALLVVGVLKHIDNKKLYLGKLKDELVYMSSEAKQLEEIEKRFDFFEKRHSQRVALFDKMYELYKVAPDNISLLSFDYEAEKQILMRAQTDSLENVFSFMSKLQNASGFKKIPAKLRYVTKKKSKGTEIVEFEIICQLN
ncbi:MAG: hypothetical protein MUF05_02785 [Candidatus Omnitrophica bacterium]|jgi:hypothetical protein|nr:hypothetical protein [Candidatus Omnitrophota bacterium]